MFHAIQIARTQRSEARPPERRDLESNELGIRIHDSWSDRENSHDSEICYSRAVACTVIDGRIRFRSESSATSPGPRKSIRNARAPTSVARNGL